MDSSDALQLLVLLILLLLSAFFSSAETALTCVNKIRIRALAEENNKRAIMVQSLTENSHKMLSAILIGNNIVNLSASSLATMLATKLAGRSGLAASPATFVGIATGILTILVLIFGEITPKSAATQNAEKMALSYAPVIFWITRILTPVIVIINLFSRGVQHFLGINPDGNSQQMTEDEFLTVVDVIHEDGVIEEDEKEMINNVVDFGDSIASDVMVPRIDVCFMDINSTYDEVVAVFREEKYSRIPVYDTNKDHIAGILNMKDIFCYTGSPENFCIKDLLRKPHFVYEFQHVSDLMEKMQKNFINFYIVLDEYGAVSGIITIEDLIEEIVGEIRDEYDTEETDDITMISDKEYSVDGNTKLEDINELLDLKLESEDYDSIAGHIIYVLGHIPVEKESVTIDHYRFTITQMDRHRIETIKIEILENESAEAEDFSKIKER